MRTALRTLFEFFRLVIQRFGAERCTQIAASLAFTTLLSLVPLLAVALVLLSEFPLFAKLSEALRAFLLANLLPQKAGDIIANYALQFTQKASRLTLIGSAVLVATAIMMMLTIDRAFNAIWQVRRPRPLMRRVLTYSLTLTVGPVILGAGIAAATYFISASLGLVHEPAWLRTTLFRALPLAVLVALFSLLYYAVPNREVAKRDALIGGFFAAAGLTVMQQLLGVYVSRFPAYTLIYGTFAAAPIFLVWLYLSWSVVLLGALIAAALPEFMAGTHRCVRHAGHGFYAALQMLRELAAAPSGAGSALRSLAVASGQSLSEAEAMLEDMAQVKWVERRGDSRWQLACALENLTLTDVFTRFAFSPQALPLPESERDGHLRERLLRAYALASADLSLPLARLFQIG